MLVYAIADTRKLMADGIITADQAMKIETRGRAAMVTLAVNALLCSGIIAATGGLIYWLEKPLAIAVCGLIALATGLVVLVRSSNRFWMFGNAAALIGAGMLIGGATLELLRSHQSVAGVTMLAAGAVIALASGWVDVSAKNSARFVVVAIGLMGVALHVAGVWYLMGRHDMAGGAAGMLHLYIAAVIACAGLSFDIRPVTAFSIIPFAGALQTGTAYGFATYAFFSPEPILTILQMSLLMASCAWLDRFENERIARHARVLAVMAFVVANLAALVGSLFGDVVGDTLWGPDARVFPEWADQVAASKAFAETATIVSASTFSIVWAAALAATALWAARSGRRGIFNAVLTFGSIHAYTQLYESFGTYPLAYVVGGLAAIPLAWGAWRLNRSLLSAAGDATASP